MVNGFKVLNSTSFYLTYVKKCRYIPDDQLSRASDEHVQAILEAIATGKIRVSGRAQRMVEYAWSMRISGFVEAVRRHLESGCRLFNKRIIPPPTDCLFFEANISRYPDSDDEDDDVYVEIRLSNGTFVIICNSHPHLDVRLPK